MQLNLHFGDPPNDAAFARYLSGESLLDERIEIERWIARDPSRRTMLSFMAAAWDEPQRVVETWDSEALLARVVARREVVDQQGYGVVSSVSRTAESTVLDTMSNATSNATSNTVRNTAEPTPQVPSPVRWHRGLSLSSTLSPKRALWASRTWGATAAFAIAAVAFLGLGVYRNATQPVLSSTMVRAEDSWEFSTAPGQRAVVTLVDGTTVTLGVASRLYPVAGFGAGHREVILEGEAHFDVVTDPSAPFMVRTGETVTRVLGTTFNVRKYATDSIVEIAVASGKVSVGHGEATTLLTAGQIGKVDGLGQSTVIRDASLVEVQMQWRDGWLVIDNMTLRQAADELARWYDLDIHISSQTLAERNVSFSSRNALPSAVIRSIAQTLGARAEWSGRQVTFFER